MEWELEWHQRFFGLVVDTENQLNHREYAEGMNLGVWQRE